MALGDCCKRMSAYMDRERYSGNPQRQGRWNYHLQSLHRCPWCFARVNTEEEGGDAKKDLNRTTS